MASLTAYVPPDGGDPGWRVRFGVGLLADAPMGEAQRATIQREEERERKAAELEEQQRQEAAVERRWMLAQQGVTPMTHAEILARASFAQDREDAAERRREREAAEELGKPIPEHLVLNKYQMKREQAAREAAKETTPATVAEVGAVQQQVQKLKSAIHAITGKSPV
jgi:hypothetical protein